jgi:hypothetical protein
MLSINPEICNTGLQYPRINVKKSDKFIDVYHFTSSITKGGDWVQLYPITLRKFACGVFGGPQ